MKKIEEWLENFKIAWKTYKIKRVIELFDENVEYWETPFVKVSSMDDLKNEWAYIRTQKNISIKTDVFSAFDNEYTVKFFLTYLDKKDKVKKFSGIYLIELNERDKCCYFFQCGELKI